MEGHRGLRISNRLILPGDEIRINTIKAQGPGGQHVNKAATAVHLRFDIPSSSLPEECKTRLLAMHDNRITNDCEIIIKAGQYRSQRKNRLDALNRLRMIIKKALDPPKKRKKTKAGKKAHLKRLHDKKHRSKLKASRSSPE